MSLTLGVVMDPIESVNIKKDSTYAMLLSAAQRDLKLFYIEPSNMFSEEGIAKARVQELFLFPGQDNWYELAESQEMVLADLNIILMRKDPPFDMEYIYCTYLLEQAESGGCLVVNRPQSLRDCNEKVFATRFPQCCPPYLISKNNQLLRDFFHQHQDVIFKPLDGMGGSSIFRVQPDGNNLGVILETLTKFGGVSIMVQKYIPEISSGDKRILLIGGEPIDYGLARIPAKGEVRGNLAAGGRGEVRALTDRERWICAELKQTLLAKGLYFVGIDVIGDYLTEINVTSPTCIQEISKGQNIDIAGQLIDYLLQVVETTK